MTVTKKERLGYLRTRLISYLRSGHLIRHSGVLVPRARNRYRIIALEALDYVYTICIFNKMSFEWDEAKNETNLAKHGIDFQGAQTIWETTVVTLQSSQPHSGEVRYLAIGLYKGREITVVYTWRGANKRLISARRASTNERKFYWQKARPDESEEAG